MGAELGWSWVVGSGGLGCCLLVVSEGTSDCVGVDSSRFMAWRGRSCVTSGMGCGGVLDWEGETSTS